MHWLGTVRYGFDSVHASNLTEPCRTKPYHTGQIVPCERGITLASMDCCVLAVSRAFSVAYVKSMSMHDCIYRRKYPDTKSASLHTKGTKRWILLYVLAIYIYGTVSSKIGLVGLLYYHYKNCTLY